MAKTKKIDMTALAVEGAVVVINGVERDTYCAEVGTQITWSVSKEGYATQSGSFILREDTTLNVVLGLDGFHFTYDNDTMTILKGTEAPSADTAGVFCIDGLWDIMINGTVLYAEGEGGDVTYGSEYLKSGGNDIIVLPREGAKIYRRHQGGYSMERSGRQQSQYISEVLSWGSCEYGAMDNFFYTEEDAGDSGRVASIPAFTEGFKNVTDFSYCFYSCSKLTSLPTGLFDACTAVTSFASCFRNCSGLTSLPTGLFDNCTAVTNFQYCFRGCSGLTGETPYSTIDGMKVHLYEREDYPDYFAEVEYHAGCFYDCTKLDDYDSIPDGWK